MRAKIICTEKVKEKIIEYNCVSTFVESKIVENEFDGCPLDETGPEAISCKECFEKYLEFEIVEEKKCIN